MFGCKTKMMVEDRHTVQIKMWKYEVVMNTLLLLSIVLITDGAPTSNTNKTALKLNGDNSTEGSYSSNSSQRIFLLSLAASRFRSFSVLKNCTLAALDEGIPGTVMGLLNSGVKLIKYNLMLEDNTTVLKESSETLVFKPLYWVRATSRQGTGLLLLRDEFDVLSFYSLAIGVSELDVTLTESPRNCLGRLGIEDIERLLRESVMNDFQSSVGQDIPPVENVCNMHVRDRNGVADFRYYCCHRDSSGKQTCQYLYEDTWLLILFYVIGVLKILVILYGPRFVPGSFYREKYVAAPYVHKLKDDISDVRFDWNIVLTKYPERFRKAKRTFKLSKFRNMKQFKETLQTLRHDVPYRVKFEDIHLKIKADRLLPEDYAPVGLLQSLYDTILKCNIRKRQSLANCCDADVCSMLPFDKHFNWYRLGKEISKLVVLVALITPWIIRIAIYYEYEHVEMHMRKDAADERSLRFYFPGNFTLLLTPLHVLFILIYILLSLESCIYGVMSKRVKEKFKFVLRRCFRDMRERNRGSVIGWAVKLSLKPCTKYGAVGFFFGIFVWAIGFPFVLVILAFYILPTLNITFRLLAHFGVYLVPRRVCTYGCCKWFYDILLEIEKSFQIDEITHNESLERKTAELKTGRGRFQQLTVIVFCLISLYSIIFLLTELISFAVEIVIHTLIGIILNASVTLTYVSLVLLLAVYANDCFGSVTKSFLAFNKALNRLILGLGQGQCEKIMYKMEDKDENLAFRVRMEKSSVVENPIELTRDMTGYPRWRISRLLLFLSKEDIPHIPKSLYFVACKMPFYAVPGELLLRYLRAALEFGAIIVFLLFVLVVVLAFGDTYEISASNQLLATVAGGFVPFMLRKVVFKTHTPPVVDSSNINFQICFTHLLEKYRQSWPIQDIIVKTPRKLEREQSVYYDCEPDTESATTEDDVTDGVLANDRSPLAGVGFGAVPQPSDVEIDLLIDVNVIDFDEFPAMIEQTMTNMIDFA